MGNFASSAFRTPSTAATLPSDAVVIDCAWLEATHTHFKNANTFQAVRTNEKKSTSLTSFLTKSCKRAATNPLWVRDALRCCSQTLRALISSPAPFPAPTPAPVNDQELFTAVQEVEHFFDDFNQVFECNATLKKSSPVSTSILSSDAVVKTVDAASCNSMLAKMRSFHNDEDEDEDDYADFEDCASYTTDATDSLSESECEGKCFSFCGGLECEPQYDSDNNDSSQNADIHNPLYSDDEDEEDEDEDCLAKAERLLRMASSCSDISIMLDDYLCTCGECPQYKIIAYEVQRYGTYADEAEMRSLTRILQAFSTYNEVIGYDCDMIPTAEECLQVWTGDELQAFKSFVTLYDEVPHLCAC